MNVNDIANGSEVKIHASINGHNVVIMTEAIFGVAVGLLVKPMEYFGKYMQFLEPSQVQIRNKRDGRIYRFMSTTISPVKTRYGNFHLIRCSSALEPENSRRAERFYIDKLGLYTVNGNPSSLKNCIIHDISMRGISLILDPGTNCKTGDSLDVRFRYGESLHNYEVSTTVVRNFTISDKPAVGCSLHNLDVDIISLISSKKKEKYPQLDNVPATSLNPDLTEKEQIREVEEDLAKQLIPEKNKKTITEVNPFDPANLEHVTLPDKTLREKRKEAALSEQSRAIENLLDLRDI